MAKAPVAAPVAARSLPTAYLYNPESLLQLTRQPAGADVFPAVILSGAAGMGKSTLAFAWACALNCLTPGPVACGQCRACRRILQAQHPDLFVLTPETASQGIKVEQVRNLGEHLQFRPFEARYRVVMFEQAENMSETAANCLLKTLEEPPPQTVFILQAINHAQVLPTIHSRCRLFKFLPVDQTALTTWLEPQGERAALAARLSGGAPGRALRLLSDKPWWTLREQALTLYHQLTHGQVAASAVAEVADQVSKSFSGSAGRDKLIEHLDVGVSWLRDGLLLQTDSALHGQVGNLDRMGDLHAVVQSGGLLRWTRSLEHILDSRLQIEGYVNTRMVLTLLFRQLVEDFSQRT